MGQTNMGAGRSLPWGMTGSRPNSRPQGGVTTVGLPGGGSAGGGGGTVAAGMQLMSPMQARLSMPRPMSGGMSGVIGGGVTAPMGGGGGGGGAGGGGGGRMRPQDPNKRVGVRDRKSVV